MMINGKDLEIGPGVDLRGADLRNSYLRGADLRGSDLRGADFIGADLREVDLRGTDCKSAHFNWVNLRGSDLRGADLRDSYVISANITNTRINYCVGDGVIIKNINYVKWKIVHTKDVMAIGCEQHTIEKWISFTDDEINAMDNDALIFWTENKAQIFKVISK